MRSMISISHVSKSYKKPLVRALNDVSFSVKRGESVGLLGPNGAGKTTLIKSISGLINFSAGKITIDGIDASSRRGKTLRLLGVVLDGSRNLYWRLTVRQNLVYFGMIRGMSYSQTKSRIPKILDLMQLGEFSNYQVGLLSSGQKQKASIAAALVHNPSFLILDEPTNGLDIPSMDNLSRVLNTLRDEMNIGILISSHNLSFVQQVSQKVVFINKGKIVDILGIDDVKEFELKSKSTEIKTDLLTVYRNLMKGDIR